MQGVFKMAYNVLRIYEVRLNEILNYKQTLVGVSCIYAVISSFYLWKQFIFNQKGLDHNTVKLV